MGMGQNGRDILLDIRFLATMLLSLALPVTAKGSLNYGAECNGNFWLTQFPFLRARDEVLCNTDKRLTCFNNVCYCWMGLQWEHDNCVTALFRPCSNDSECVSNAKCERSGNMRVKVCECGDGYHFKDGLCVKQISKPVVSISRTMFPQDPDCVYIKSQSDKKIVKDGIQFYFSPRYEQTCVLTGGRGHVVDVSCPTKNDTVIHMCCRYRQDIQESRQPRFRVVGHVITLVSGENCAKRILCEQACRDRLKGKPASSYPIELPTDGIAEKGYVHAYLTGEAVAVATMQCCEEDKLTCINSVRTLRCDDECRAIFPKCESTGSWRSWAFVKSAPVLHSVGIGIFNAEWIVRDKLAAGLERMKGFWSWK